MTGLEETQNIHQIDHLDPYIDPCFIAMVTGGMTASLFGK